MSKPRSPGSAIGDPAEAGYQGRPTLNLAALDHGGCFVDDGLVEPRASPSCLIDHVSGDPVAHEIGLPAFASVRRRLQARSGVAGSVHHDDRRHVLFFACRYLELHIHLSDRNLAGDVLLIGIGRRGTVAYLVTFGTPPMKK